MTDAFEDWRYVDFLILRDLSGMSKVRGYVPVQIRRINTILYSMCAAPLAKVYSNKNSPDSFFFGLLETYLSLKAVH